MCQLGKLKINVTQTYSLGHNQKKQLDGYIVQVTLPHFPMNIRNENGIHFDGVGCCFDFLLLDFWLFLCVVLCYCVGGVTCQAGVVVLSFGGVTVLLLSIVLLLSVSLFERSFMCLCFGLSYWFGVLRIAQKGFNV